MYNFDTQNINVLNYNENEVFVDSAREHYKFSASRDGKTPSIVPMSLDELQYIASNTDIIITGWLTFDENVKEELYEKLRIANWKDILTNEDIKDILTSPTKEGLQKLIDIKSQTYFDRVRIVMFRLMQDGVDITTKVDRIVEQRYNELRKKQRNSSIIITKKDTQVFATPEDVKALSEQNATLQSQLIEMKRMMEEMMSMQNAQKTDETIQASNTPTSLPLNEETKKAGRPKKNA